MELSVFLTILSPLILPADLLLLLGGEVVRDVESLANFFWGFALNHIGNRLAANIKERLNIQIVRSLRKDKKVS